MSRFLRAGFPKGAKHRDTLFVKVSKLTYTWSHNISRLLRVHSGVFRRVEGSISLAQKPVIDLAGKQVNYGPEMESRYLFALLPFSGKA